MSILNAVISASQFNASRDKIALMLQSLTLFKKADFGRFSEPYVIGFSVSANQKLENPFDFIYQTYPKTRKNEKKEFQGEGLRLYGPDNPGEFLAFSILLLESDADVREAGTRIESALNSDLIQKTLPKLFVANPTAAIASKGLLQLTNLFASIMQGNKDDELLRMSGTLFQNVIDSEFLPYQVQETFADRNSRAELEVKVLPLLGGTRHRKQTKPIAVVQP